MSNTCLRDSKTSEYYTDRNLSLSITYYLNDAIHELKAQGSSCIRVRTCPKARGVGEGSID